MALETLLDLPLLTYSRARTLGFTAEFMLLNSLSKLIPGNQKHAPKFKASRELTARLRDEVDLLLRGDVASIREGHYPASVLKPESPREHLSRLPRVIWDGARIYRRRARGKTTEFTPEITELLHELPRYYRRNFHHQTDGYLSERSAEVYEHQVEMLFSGTADPMRRLIIPALKTHFKNSDGAGLTFLEVAAGTGRATRFVHQAFPKARIVATDLSDAYLKHAQKKLADCGRVDFLRAAGENLPFSDGKFDAVYSVFLFHELPMDARRAVIAEARRVLRPG
ncbi:MAG: class I SAM-dependent methyltransferase, partial [Bdellovibrionota bacterium]